MNEELGIAVDDATRKIQENEAKQVRELFGTERGRRVLEILIRQFYYDDLCVTDQRGITDTHRTFERIGMRKVIEYLVQLNAIGETGQ